jgi:hypothetical protein
MARTRTSTIAPKSKTAKSYKHPESESPMRPEVGTQSEFKKKLSPKKYRLRELAEQKHLFHLSETVLDEYAGQAE